MNDLYTADSDFDDLDDDLSMDAEAWIAKMLG